MVYISLDTTCLGLGYSHEQKNPIVCALWPLKGLPKLGETRVKMKSTHQYWNHNGYAYPYQKRVAWYILNVYPAERKLHVRGAQITHFYGLGDLFVLDFIKTDICFLKIIDFFTAI